jgi:hypothetical protein
VHNLVLNKVQTERDGAWRKLDSKTLDRWRRAAAEIAAAEMETALTRDFGLAWVPRPDGHGREIAGVSQELMDHFSARRREISKQARKVAEQREQDTGRRPDAWQMSRIHQDITLRTRQHKPEAPLDLPGSLRDWDAEARAADLGDLAAIPDAALAAARHEQDQHQLRDLPAGREVVRRVARSISLEFARQHGRAPDRAEFARIERFVSFVTLRGADLRPVEATELVQGPLGANLPVVLTCDCNADPTSAAYAVLRTAGLKDSWLQAQTGEPGFTCCQSPTLLNPASTLASRIDYIFVRGGGLTAADAQIVGADPGDRSTPSGFWPSDHAGLFAELQQD